MSDRRFITIYFMDGKSMRIDFPAQTDNQGAQVIRLKEALAQRHLVVEADGTLLVLPFENIKYIQASPAPAKLPEFAIKAASFSS